MSNDSTHNGPVSKGGDELARLTRWRAAIDGLRPRMTGRAWRHGERNVARLAKALGVSRDTVYADLRDQHIDYRDRKAPVTPVEDGLPDYQYVNERVLDSIVAANAVPIGLRAMAEGYDTQTREGRCQLLERLLDEPDNDVAENLIRCESSLERGRLDIPGVGETAVWRGTSVDRDGRIIGWGLLGIPEMADDPAMAPLRLSSASTAKLTEEGIALACLLRAYEENRPRRDGSNGHIDPEHKQQGVDNLAHVIAAIPTLPAPTKPQRCLIHTCGTTTAPGIQRGDTTVDVVRIGFPIWIY